MEKPPPLPLELAKLVLTQSSPDLQAEITTLLREGRRRITVGIGPSVDVPLLDEELHSLELADLERELVVMAIRCEPDGFVIERGWTNFGVYVLTPSEKAWESVPHVGERRGLRPGDEIALGSTPAEALKFTLPESPLVPPPRLKRSARHEKLAAQQQEATPPTAADRRAAQMTPPTVRRFAGPGRTTPPPVTREATPPLSSRGTPVGAAPRATPAPALHRVPRDRYQALLEGALRHWRYDVVTFGGDARSIVHLDDPALASLRAAITRNVDAPDRGMELFVKDANPDLWVAAAGEGVRLCKKGDVLKLKGPGNRLGFGPYLIELPEPVPVTPRFGPRATPSQADVSLVLGLALTELGDADLVKARHRDLARRFHPDLHPGNSGHLSRFLEIQACFDSWKASR